MSGLPSGISVLRHVPVHLLDGFTSGEYRLWGGVLRRTAGGGRGQIVGFLTEGRDLIQRVEQNLPIKLEALQSSIGDVQMASQIMMGANVLNLGVQVAGFALVLNRLNNVSAQIEGVRRDLFAIGENINWLTIGMMADLCAGAQNALATAERAVRQNNHILLNQAKTQGDRARRHLAYLSSEMLATGRALPQRSLFEQFIKLASLVAYAEARCDEAVEGAGQAAHDLRVSSEELRRIVEMFRDQVRDFEAYPLALLTIGDSGRAETKAIVERISAVVGRLEGYVPQLEFQDALGLDPNGWRDLVASEDSGPITCITFDGKPQGDLVEAVRSRPTMA